MTTESEVQTYNIPSWNIGKLEKKLTSMNKKAAKFGLPLVGYEVLQTFQQIAPEYQEAAAATGLDHYPKITIYEIEVVGEGPKIEGWKFIGTLDLISLPGFTVVQTVPGETVPREYFEHDGSCDHCNKIRRRNETFVLESDDGEFQAVGRQCVRDFIGHDPRQVVSWLTGLNRFVAALDDEDGYGYGGGSRQDMVYDHLRVLRATAAVIRENGWVPKSSASVEEGRPATAHLVLDTFHSPRDAKEKVEWQKWMEKLDIDNERNAEEAEAARAWLKTQPNDNEYFHNLHLIDDADAVPEKLFGYWCSVMSGYYRHIEREVLNKAQSKKNEYLDVAVKDKVEIDVTVVGINWTEGYYGSVGVHRMLDKEGRTVVWFANTDPKMERGKKYRIAGTVKKLDEYKGWKQTTLTRVRVRKELENDRVTN